MSSALKPEQMDLLRDVAAGRCKRSTSGLADIQLLQRAGLVARDVAKARLRITDAGKRYVAFVEQTRSSSGSRPVALSLFDQSNHLEKPGSL